jgi:hypothetical protein
VDDFCHQIMDVSSMEQDSSKNEWFQTSNNGWFHNHSMMDDSYHQFVTQHHEPYHQFMTQHHEPFWYHQQIRNYSFFPVRGTSEYAADHNNSSRTPDDADSCCKYSSSHPTLTPGIFTLYCLIAVCYRFEVMRSHESPWHPFEIFLTHFEQPPTIIIYDNAAPVRPQPPPNPLPEHELFLLIAFTGVVMHNFLFSCTCNDSSYK